MCDLLLLMSIGMWDAAGEVGAVPVGGGYLRAVESNTRNGRLRYDSQTRGRRGFGRLAWTPTTSSRRSQ